MACEISIIIIMAPRAAMSADGRSLIGNELSHHPKGTCLALCYLELYACLRLCELTYNAAPVCMFLCMEMRGWIGGRGDRHGLRDKDRDAHYARP